MSNPDYSNKLLHEIALDQEAEKGLECVKNFEKTQIILNNGLSDSTFFKTSTNPGSSSPGHTPITKEQKIEVVNRALDDETLSYMQNGDKIKYFDNNVGSLVPVIKEVLNG